MATIKCVYKRCIKNELVTLVATYKDNVSYYNTLKGNLMSSSYFCMKKKMCAIAMKFITFSSLLINDHETYSEHVMLR